MLTIFLGAPGSGKGTISEILANENGFTHISTGDIFRNLIRSKTPLGIKLKDLIESGHLVDDETTWEVAKSKLQDMDLNEKIILDGYPRNILQAQYLRDYLKSINFSDVKIIYYEAPREIIVQRLSGRLMCPVCGKSYHKTNFKPLVEGQCDNNDEL